MNIKKICFISLFLLFLILNTACAHDFDNSTEAISQVQDDELICDGENDYSHDFGQWVLDENGNLIYVPSDENTSFHYFDDYAPEGNVTDLRNDKPDPNSTDISNQSQMTSPSTMDSIWNEFIKDPQDFMEKYHSLPDTVSIDWEKYLEAKEGMSFDCMWL